jgi:hypothetical protein
MLVKELEQLLLSCAPVDPIALFRGQQARIAHIRIVELDRLLFRVLRARL